VLVEQVDKMFAAEVDAMAKKFLEEHPEGVFVAYRIQQPPHMNATRLSILSCLPPAAKIWGDRRRQSTDNQDKKHRQEYGREQKRDKTCFR
jgi:hypothetical protein